MLNSTSSKFAEQKFARYKKGPDFLRASRFAMNRSKPAHPNQLGDTACIFTVGLDRHRRKSCFDVPRLEKHGFKSGTGQSGMQPLR
jgi:hypothetical protein